MFLVHVAACVDAAQYCNATSLQNEYLAVDLVNLLVANTWTELVASRSQRLWAISLKRLMPILIYKVIMNNAMEEGLLKRQEA